MPHVPHHLARKNDRPDWRRTRGICQLDGESEVNLKSKTYMKSAEFKARQLWLPFEDAVGIALQIMEPIKESAAKWFKAWKKHFCGRKPWKISTAFQFPLPFEPSSNYTI